MLKRKLSKTTVPSSQRRQPTLDDGEIPGTSSQKKNSQSSGKSTAALSAEEIQRVACDLVHYFLIASQKKLPIKRTDIMKNVMKGNGRQYKDVFYLAKSHLNKVFGMDVVELDDKKNSYILVNVLNKKIGSEYLLSYDEDSAKTGLLMLVLSLIFMSGNILNEDIMWKTLKTLGVEAETPHQVFGDVKKLITHEFKQQLYLEMVKIDGSDPVTHQLSWGARASHELSKMKVLEFVCKVFGENMTCNYWLEQYHDALENSTENTSE